ncbi:ABC transporter ATP-binding protein [Orrella sp. NBD-18]|uniref:ABC transporter ATP-binding protein n=1 Tax=Sheuella amnicola TaxID=2707330 RepID=A0A6B2QX50_9BURK|nr:ABC transporter ATP-binding protein [Sheuella amnicola]NDY82562.1 ABC transporter ATP-binding protein [Sheuella amnicola]HBI84276.1 Fe3+/spermidine/putrescine ABC transporter ATP-binding protein [Alcaligenaceae bacterium]
MANVSLLNLKKQFGGSVAVSDFSLEIADGELVAFLGPSGCGKTTTLRMIAGFIEPTSGRILIGEADVTNTPVHKRNTGMVFQRYALFPHMTVAQNVSFGLEMHKIAATERDKRIRNALDMVRMSELKDRYPRQLSGGQQQRVAIARALAIEPKVFLLDEPLSNLDAKLRLEVREEIRTLQKRLGLTTIFVTHDQEEALAISDRMAIMHDGKVQQIGTPQSVYEQPTNLFVADFLGKMNFFNGAPTGDRQFLTEHGVTLKVGHLKPDTTIIGIRPERTELWSEPNAGNHVPVSVQNISYLGAHIHVQLEGPGRQRLTCQIPNTREQRKDTLLKTGANLYLGFKDTDCAIFNERSHR